MRSKKSLGQHFLQDQKALSRIVAAADLKLDDKVLEIGPGKGALTKGLVKKCEKIIAVEKDSVLAHELETKSKKTKVVDGDILKINLPELIEQNDFFDYKVVANIPYYITGKIIRLLFETKHSPKLIVLLVQKEVAERICSTKEKMSILAVSVQYFGKPQIVDYVQRESFDPTPKVDSAILKIVPFKGQKNLKKEAKELFRIVKMGFASRRKTLVNNLASGLHLPKADVELKINQLSLDLKARAEDLSVEQWKKLVELFD